MNDSIELTRNGGELLCLAGQGGMQILDLVETEALGELRYPVYDAIQLGDKAEDVFAIQRSNEGLIETQKRFAEDLASGEAILLNVPELPVEVRKASDNASNCFAVLTTRSTVVRARRKTSRSWEGD